MPIIGLTDRTPSFKELGRLRLGIPKSEAAVSGPKEISYFRADFRPDATDAYALFVDAYGQQPTSINFRLPFPEINRCWDAYYEVYNKFGMLGMADGKRWIYLRHNRTGELLVKDGVPMQAEGTQLDENGLPYLPFDPKTPVYSYTSKKGDPVNVLARPTGRLRILIPELKRAAYVQIITNSLYNVIHLSEQLAGIAEIAKSAGMTIPQVPLTITRRKETISVSFNGHKQMQERYLLNIEIDPRWMEAQFNYLQGLMPGTTPPVWLPSLPAVVSQHEFTSDDLSEASETDVIIDENGDQYLIKEAPVEDDSQSELDPIPTEHDAEPPIQPNLNNGHPRPYPPEVLKAKLDERLKIHLNKKATSKQRSLVAMLLGEIFAGPDSDLMRHATQKYLFTAASLKEITDAAILAALDWLEPKADSGGAYHVSDMAAKEAQAAYLEAIKSQGQEALF